LAAGNPKPLAGKRILVTRAREQAKEFVEHIEALGGEVLSLPTIAFTEPVDSVPLRSAIRNLDKYDWLIFTSRNSVDFFCKGFAGLESERANRHTSHPKVAVVGPATYDQACAVGFFPEYQARESRGEALANELGPRIAGKRVLLPRSDRANGDLPAALRAAGAEVDDVVAYRTIAPESFDEALLEEVLCGKVDIVTLFSPSAYRHLADQIGMDALCVHRNEFVIAAIGPVTAAAIRKDGLEVQIEAQEQTAVSLAHAITDYFAHKAQAGANSR